MTPITSAPYQDFLTSEETSDRSPSCGESFDTHSAVVTDGLDTIPRSLESMPPTCMTSLYTTLYFSLSRIKRVWNGLLEDPQLQISRRIDVDAFLDETSTAINPLARYTFIFIDVYDGEFNFLGSPVTNSSFKTAMGKTYFHFQVRYLKEKHQAPYFCAHALFLINTTKEIEKELKALMTDERKAKVIRIEKKASINQIIRDRLPKDLTTPESDPLTEQIRQMAL